MSPIQNIKAPSSDRPLIKEFRKWFVTGFLFIAPIILTIWIIVKLFLFADGFLGVPINFILHKIGVPFKIHGVGIIALVVIIFITGWFTHQYLGARATGLFRRIMLHIPLVNKVYDVIRQIAEALLGGQKEVFKSAVLLEWPRKGMYCIGFITQDTRGVIQDAVNEDVISVFLPTTPNPTSGFLLFLPKEDVIFLDITVAEALKLIISAGAIVPEKGGGSYATALRMGISIRSKRQPESKPDMKG